MRCVGLALTSLLLAPIGCAQLAPQASASSAYPEAAPAPIQAPAPAADLDLDLDVRPDAPLPEAGPCDAAPVTDPRCPRDVVTAAAMSYLDKTVAEFDGHTMRVIEYDRDALLGEAYADAGFRHLLQQADAAPVDGILDHTEARTLESSVHRLIDAKLARR